MQETKTKTVSITWNCEKCKATGAFQTNRENVTEYLAYYGALVEQHSKHRKRKNCRFNPEKIHVTELKEN